MNNTEITTYHIFLHASPDAWDLTGGSRRIPGVQPVRIDPAREFERIASSASAAGVHVVVVDEDGDFLDAIPADSIEIEWSSVWEKGGHAWDAEEWQNWFNSQDSLPAA